jgi:hypothetical protein
LNANIIANNAKALQQQESTAGKAAMPIDISVVNNPFTSYIDIRFTEQPKGKVQFVLSDMAGRPVTATEAIVPGNTYRFNIVDKSIKSGVYALSVTAKGINNKVIVMH